MLLGIVGGLILLWWLRDRRTPEQRLADAIRTNDREYLREHLPPLTAAEADAVMRRVLSEIDDEARYGEGSGDWDQARFDGYTREEQLSKAKRRLGV